MAAPNKPKTDQKRSVPAAENGASESGKKKALAELWQGPLQGLDWAGLAGLGLGLGCGLASPDLDWHGWAGLLKWAGLAPKA